MIEDWLLEPDGAIEIELRSYLHFFVDMESHFAGIRPRRGAF